MLETCSDCRVDDAVQFFNAPPAECNFGQFGAIHAPVRIDDIFAKRSYDVIIDSLAGLHKLASHFIRVHYVCSAGSKHSSDNALAASQPAGEPDGQRHCTARLRRMRAAFTVFDISMAMVSGPTPPGTGVMAPATSATLGWTSPTRVEPFALNSSSRFGSSPKYSRNFFLSITRLIPTSMTVAPGFTISGVTMAGFPIAATRISAIRVHAERSTVRLWQTITVAWLLINIIATGLPTMSLRPSTTAQRPAISIPLRCSISITPVGVHGVSPGRWVER